MPGTKRTLVTFMRETKLEEKGCLRCGKEFIGAKVSRYCSRSCRNSADYERHKEQYRKVKVFKYNQNKRHAKPGFIRFETLVRKVPQPEPISVDRPEQRVSKPITVDVLTEKITDPGPHVYHISTRRVSEPGPDIYQVNQKDKIEQEDTPTLAFGNFPLRNLTE